MKSKSLDFQAHDLVLKSIRQYDPQTIIDGPVVPTRYANAKPRILWVLREPHGGGVWDLCRFLSDDSKLFGYRYWYCTFGALAKISYGLIRCLETEDVKRRAGGSQLCCEIVGSSNQASWPGAPLLMKPPGGAKRSNIVCNPVLLRSGCNTILIPDL